MIDISQMNTLFGSRCDGDTLQLSFNTFDIGSNDGLNEATSLAFLLSRICMCNKAKCSEEQCPPLREQVRERDIDPNKSERAGIASMSSALAGHECLDAAIGVEIYKNGYTCGLTTGLRSGLLRTKLESVFVKSFGEDDGRAYADSCWTELQAASTGR